MASEPNHKTADQAELERLRARVTALEEALIFSDAIGTHYRRIADLSPDWIYWLTPDGLLRYVSPACEPISGYTPEDFLADPDLLNRIVHPADQAHVRLHNQLSQYTHGIEFRIITRSGQVRWIQQHCRPIYADDGTWLGQLAGNRDITTWMEQSELYRNVVEHSAAALVIYQDQKVVFASPSATQFCGYTPAEIAAMSNEDLVTLIHPEDRERFAAYREMLLQEHQLPSQFSLQIRHKDGTVRWISAIPARVMFRNQPALLFNVVDITQQVRFRNELAASKKFVDAIIAALPDILYIYNVADLRDISIAGATQAALGYTPEELLRLDPAEFLELFHPDDLPAIEATRQGLSTAPDQTFVTYKCRFKHAAGAWRWFSVHETIFERDAAGEPSRYLGVAHDISEQKQIEEELSANRALLQTIVDHAPMIILSKNQHRRYTLVNRRLEQILGCSRDQLVGKTADEVFPAQIAAVYNANDQSVLQQGRKLETEEPILVDGTLSTILSSIFPLTAGNGEVSGLGLIATDITERKLAETQLQRVNAELVQVVHRLRRRNYEMRLLKQISDMLQGCLNVDEAYEVVALTSARLFDGMAGGLYVQGAVADQYEVRAAWGDPPPQLNVLSARQCRALQTGSSTPNCPIEDCGRDSGAAEYTSSYTLCVPLLIDQTVQGVLCLQGNRFDVGGDPFANLRRLAEMFTHQLALALSNLSLRERLQQQALQDGLTGLYNRRYLDENLPRELQRADRSGKALGLIMLDIDRFKRFNDTYGHDAGDALLREVGAFLKRHTRSADIACRYGGEEFVLVLPDLSPPDLAQRAEEVRAGISNLKVQYARHTFVLVTVSLGVAIYPDHKQTADDLIKAADEALYAAKHAGRNRVVFYSDDGVTR
jgi:diguanylate cyclase (GGDEF)-like protein/PAS domain S-box-containing protein